MFITTLSKKYLILFAYNNASEANNVYIFLCKVKC